MAAAAVALAPALLQAAHSVFGKAVMLTGNPQTHAQIQSTLDKIKTARGLVSSPTGAAVSAAVAKKAGVSIPLSPNSPASGHVALAQKLLSAALAAHTTATQPRSVSLSRL